MTVEKEKDLFKLVQQNIADEWLLDSDGFPHRKAARVVILNPFDETYLIKGHDYADKTHCWWFTVGGGANFGESFRECACRELREETGLILAEDRLEGPVLFREATFNFVDETRKQDEYFYLLRVNAAEQKIIDSGEQRKLTILEQEVLDNAGWFSVDELQQFLLQGEKIYPNGFVWMLEKWLAGWDGEMQFLREE